MKVSYQDSMLYKVQSRIEDLPGKVIIRKDLEELGGYRQISRVLQELLKKGKIVRISSGAYAKARFSTITGEVVPAGSFSAIARELLNRLGVEWKPGRAEQDYNAGLSTQVPVRGSVIIKGRFRRKIAWKGMKIPYERS